MKRRPEARLIEHYRVRYHRSNRAHKKEILDEFCVLHGYHHKAATRLLNNFSSGCTLKTGPGAKRRYDPSVFLKPLQNI